MKFFAPLLTALVSSAYLVSAASWPNPSGGTAVTKTIKVTVDKPFNGKNQRFYSKGLGNGDQGESQKPLFELEAGAKLSNVVIGAPGADGIHCLGSCTLTGVWFEDVGEDAITFKGSGTMLVDGGGAKKAADKIINFNGGGTATVRNFDIDDFGKLGRSCGNCKKQYQRNWIIENVTAKNGRKSLIGINKDRGDTATFRNIKISGKKIDVCALYQSAPSGKEPKELGPGKNNANCKYTDKDVKFV